MNGVCRFFSTSFAPKSSHFYTPFADECATVNANPDWQFEAIAFYVELPKFNGNCLPGTQAAVTASTTTARAGRRTIATRSALEVRDLMLQQGWIPEGYGLFGAIACVPV